MVCSDLPVRVETILCLEWDHLDVLELHGRRRRPLVRLQLLFREDYSPQIKDQRNHYSPYHENRQLLQNHGV